MDPIRYLPFKVARRLYCKVVKEPAYQPEDDTINCPDTTSELIRSKIHEGAPYMISRFGSTELSCILNYLSVTADRKQRISYMLGKSSAWWWQESIRKQMKEWSGFFPSSEQALNKFCELSLSDTKQVDLLGSWLGCERLIPSFSEGLQKTRLLFLDPYWSEIPWTSALEGKKVVVVHPFKESIEKQYRIREKLHRSGVLPDFDLTVVRSVQSLGGSGQYNSWFDALDMMKSELDALDYEIALIGCGAYGMPMAAHVKRMGKIGIHIGGSLQLLFGIMGSRWESADYAKSTRDSFTQVNYSQLKNTDWVKPMKSERPSNSASVEQGCYW